MSRDLRNCVTSQKKNYPAAPSVVRKDPCVERSTTNAFDTDAWAQKTLMRDWKNAVRPERDIYQNPKQEVRKYPINLFIDSVRKSSDIDDFTDKGIFTYNLVAGSDRGVSSDLSLRNIIRAELPDDIRIPYVDNPQFYLYDKFSLEITNIGSKFEERDIAGYGNNTPFHFWLEYEFDNAITPNFIILKTKNKCVDFVPQGSQPENIGFRLRTPFLSYTFPADRLVGTITTAGSPTVITLNQGHNLAIGDYVAFIDPNTSSPSLNAALANQGGIPTTAVATPAFTINVDSTGALGDRVEVIIVKNRIVFPILLEGLR